MLHAQEQYLSLTNNFAYETKKIDKKYNIWRESSRILQIRSATFLTGTLYLIYSQLDKFSAPADMLTVMSVIHLYIIAPILFAIGILTFWKFFYNISVFLLFVAPIIATIGNLFIVVHVNEFNTYLTEIYLIIFWIFTISGLRLLYATLSAFIILIVVLIVTFFLFPIPHDQFIMHFFWLLSAISIGFLNAYLIDRSSKTFFLKSLRLESELDNTKKLENRLLTFNETLEKRIEDEIEVSREKDKIIFQQNKLVAMGEMIENIAHQWRQPISQINSAVLVMHGTLQVANINNPTLKNKLLEIEYLTKYMSNTIDAFRNLFENSKQKEKFTLQEVINNSISILRGSLLDNNIEVELLINNNSIINGYPQEIQQVIFVIVNNARDALISKKIEKPMIMITTLEREDKHIINICDNAGGIEETIIDKIFEPYYTTKHKSKGTGLGLYISKMIIEDAMDGYIHVNNIHDGACFTIELKKEESDE